MIVTPKVLLVATATTVQATCYTVPNNTTTIIDKFTVTNYGATAANMSIYLVSAGGTIGNPFMVVKTRTIQPGETYTCPEIQGHVLSSGDFIATIASAANTISMRSSGREIT